MEVRNFFHLEKRSFLTFVSKLYQREIKLNCSDDKDKPHEIQNLYQLDLKLKTSVATAIQDPNLTIEDAKALLRQLSGKVLDLEERLSDYEDTEQQVAVEELP